MPRGRGNRERLLEAGRELFASRSYHATGVQQITDAAGVPKGSFYNYFRSKDDFGIEVLRRYCGNRADEMEALLVAAEGEPLERLRHLFERTIDAQRESEFAHGCLAGNLAQEVGASDPGFREALETYFRSVQSQIAEVLFEAQQAGALSPAVDPGELAGFLYHAWQGALVRMKASRTDRPLRQFQEMAFEHLLRA